LSRHHVLAGVEASLRRLQTDVIDLLYVHCWDEWTPLDETLRAIDDLVTAGKIRYIGVSNYKSWQLMKALALSDLHGWNRFVAAQYQYSLVERNLEHEISDLCTHEGVGLVPWGALGGGFLTGKYDSKGKPDQGRLSMMADDTEEAWARRNIGRNWEIMETVIGLAKEHDATPSQVALAWLLHQPAVASIVLGARTPEQLQDNLSSGQVQLDDEQIARLNQVSEPAQPYPYGFLRKYGDRDPAPEYSV
jgi:aryl-alcohol dehydrogenase-like predicted oxidoreductase